MLKGYLKRKVAERGVTSLANVLYGALRPAPSNKLFAKSPDMVFIWIPKSAGSSVFGFLNAGLGMRKFKTANHLFSFRNRGSVTFGHIHYLSLVKFGFVSGNFHENAFKFAVVRNPYSRVASLYNYSTRRDFLGGEGFDRFLDSVVRRPPVGLYNRIGLSQANPQTDWLMGEDGEMLTDRIFKVETIEEFGQYFSDNYGLQFDPSERRNSSDPLIRPSDILDKGERLEKVNSIYARDFELLDYEMVTRT